MAEREETRGWTDADDELVRRALSTLRTDVDAAPLSDVRFVKARGRARRRTRFVAWTAAGAAAAVVVAAVGFSALGGRDGASNEIPAGPSPSSTGPTVPGVTDVAGALPVAAEWATSLGATPELRIEPLKEFDSVDCQPTFPGRPDIAQGVYAVGEDPGAAGFQGTQAHFTAATAAEGAAAAQQVVDDLVACAGVPIEVTTVTASGELPAVLTYAADNGSGGFYVVAQHDRDVTYLVIAGDGESTPDITAAQVSSLGAVAQARLLAYGADGTDPAPPDTPATNAPEPTVQAPVDEEMPVVGPDPDYPSSLFVAASQWASEALTQGYATEAGTGDYEGSAAVASCDVDTEATGNVGIVSVRDRDGFIGKQRVRGATSIGDSDTRVQALEDGFDAGCTFANGTVTSKPGPEPRTWQLTTTYADGDAPDLVEYVGVTPFGESLISTIVITDAPTDESAAFGELVRLMALAAQK